MREATIQRMAISTIGVKILMAASGLMMSGWLVAHLGGNLMVFFGPETINDYGHKLRSVPGLLWGMRLVLSVHLSSAFTLMRRNRSARAMRPNPVGRFWRQAAARSMGLNGSLILVFLIYHVLHIYGPLHPSFIEGDIHHNLVAGLRSPLHAGVYLVGTLLMGIHLHHGLWSTLRSLGVSGATGRLDRWLNRGSRALGGLITVGFLIPLFAAALGLI
ncbi:MAG: succinate dehydrogenase cytochrome b subunit [Myxococcota bacterium]